MTEKVAKPQDATPAIIYAAKSTEDKHGSIPTQIEDCRAMAKSEGWNVVADPYRDENRSAWTGDRGDGLAEAMAHAERIAPCVLIVQHTDRIARGDGKQARHLIEVYFWAMRAGVTVRSVQDDSTFENLVLAAVMGERNAEDSRRKSLSVAAGMKRSAEAGKHHGGPPPYGYAYPLDGEGQPVRGSTWKLDRAEAEVVRRIFREYKAGRSQHEIARGLREDEVPTRRGKWHQGTISAVLRNPTYRGLVRHKGETFPGKHEAIVDDALWSAVADRRERLTRTKARGGGRPPRAAFLFVNGTLRCSCGEAMVPRSDSESYYCYGRKQDPGSCGQGPIPRRIIDGAIYRHFERVGLDVEETRAAMEAASAGKVAEVRALAEAAERDVHKAADALARMKGYVTEGRIEPEDWNEQRPELTEALQGAEAKADQMRAQLAEVESGADLRDVEGESLRALAEIRKSIAGAVADAGNVEAARAAILSLFEGFTLHRAEDLAEAQMDDDYDGPRYWEHDLLLPGFYIEPHVRAQAIESAAPEGSPDGAVIFPVLHKTSLPVRPLADVGGLTR